MTTFGEQVAEHVESVFINPDHWAVSVVFTPDVGSPVTADAVIEQVLIDVDNNERGRENAKAWCVFVAEADLANPTRRMTVTIPDGDYRVHSYQVDFGLVTIWIGDHAAIEVSRAGYRGPRRRGLRRRQS